MKETFMNSLFFKRLINSKYNSNWTFIVLNPPYSKRLLGLTEPKTVNQFQYPGTERGQAPQRTPGGE